MIEYQLEMQVTASAGSSWILVHPLSGSVSTIEEIDEAFNAFTKSMPASAFRVSKISKEILYGTNDFTNVLTVNTETK